MPFKPLSVGAFICEKILEEKDEVNTAVRIVDVFQIPSNAPPDAPVRMYAVIIIKALPSEGSHRLALKHKLPSGKLNRVGKENTVTFAPVFNDPTIPTGVTINVEIRVRAKDIGTHTIQALIDDKKIASVFFTLRLRDLDAKA